MLKFQYPFFLLLLFLPWVMRYVKRQDLEGQQALRFPEFSVIQNFSKKQTIKVSKKSFSVSKFLLWASWVALVLAIALPQWVGEPIELPRTGRDLLLAIDVSPSMEFKDIQSNNVLIDRLTAVKEVAKDFVGKRQGDRLGLILFGSQAYLQTPLTFDRKTIQYMIEDASPKLAGNGTAIGDAIGLAVKRLKGIESESRILILLTDGMNTAGEVDPITAAEMAAEENIKIYTIGLGAQQMIVQDFFGPKVFNPSQELDEKTLKIISEKTQGLFFRTTDGASLKEVYEKIDELEPTSREGGTYLPRTDLFHWPLSLVLVLSLILFVRRIRI